MFSVNSFSASAFSTTDAIPKSSTRNVQRRIPLQNLSINVIAAQSSALPKVKKSKRGLEQTDFAIFEDTTSTNFVDGPAPKKFRKGRMPLDECKDFANISPSPSPRSSNTPFRRSPGDPDWADRENYDPRPVSPVSRRVVDPPVTRSSWDDVPVNGGPPPLLTPPPFDSPRRPTRPLRRTTRPAPLSTPVGMELYEILELREWGVCVDVILAAYRKLVLIWHPDRVCKEEQEVATAMMKKLNGAKEVLADPARRREYHQTGTLPWNV